MADIDERDVPRGRRPALATVQSGFGRRAAGFGLLLASASVLMAACSSVTSSHANPAGTTSSTVASTTSTTTSPPTAAPISTTSGSSETGIISTDGTIGSLRFGVSTEANIDAVAGVPVASVTASFAAPGRPDYHALGYGCSMTQVGSEPTLQAGEYCQTIYYLNTSTGTFQGFVTSSPMFRTSLGTTVGMSSSEAAGLEGQSAHYGCRRAIGPILGPDLRIYLDVGPTLTDNVTDIAVETLSNDVGLLFC